MKTNNSSTVPALLIKNVTKFFGGVKAVSDVSFTLDATKSKVLIGPNGAGKSTLFNLITGELSMDKGEVHLFGFDLSNSSVQKRAELGLSRTYQLSNLFKSMTVEENLFLSLRNSKWGKENWFLTGLLNWQNNSQKTKRIQEIAHSVSLESRLKETVSNLSHGEQRQLEIGMAIAPDPKLILLDEPLAGLSVAERASMHELILKLVAEKPMLIIEHDMDFALSITDHVIVLSQGSLIASGHPEAIKKDTDVQKIYKLN